MRGNAPSSAAMPFGVQNAHDPAQLIAALKRHIARAEGSLASFTPRRGKQAVWATGIAAIDDHLAASGLARGGLHGIAPEAYGDMPAAMGFATALALNLFAQTPEDRRPLLWVRDEMRVREYGRLYGHGLARLGLTRARFVTVTLKKRQSVLWTLEEALKSGALALVAGDADPRSLSLTAMRRLVLAAAAGKSAGLLVLSHAAEAMGGHSHWSAAAALSRPPPVLADVPGDPAWAIELKRARGGRPGRWHVEWNRETHRFHLAAGISGGALHPYADENGIGKPGPGGKTVRAG
jgi:protein ImuA